ncbi:glycosyltransferase family 2 protein [Enterococcus diestrammenae]|uniref:glycosyltransferase family 2 protein n=1 Tax=Enterococcus diestrammenae TaxID=1155073 RepID=UPI0019580856
MDKILISIVTYNSKDIFQTLDRLAAEVIPSGDFQVVVYDNGSEAEYRQKIASYPFVTLLAAEQNQGFGYGHNQVLLPAKNRYAIICNPDILVTKADVDVMIAKMKQQEAAAVCPKVLNLDGSTQHLVRHRLAVFDYFLRFVSIRFLNRLFDKRLADFECRDLPTDRDSFIKMGSGCFMLVDVAKFKAIDGFDERFFMYFEDNDLCLRFGKAGEQILYTPEAQVTHLYGKGAHKSFRLFRIFIQSMGKFFSKWGWRFF